MCKRTSLFDLEGFPKSGKGKKRITSDSDAFYVERVNYPSNCFTLNIANDNDVQAKGITNIRFLLKKPEYVDTKSYHIDLNVIGKEIATNRDITEHFFYSTGDSLKARPGFSVKYVMEIRDRGFRKRRGQNLGIAKKVEGRGGFEKWQEFFGGFDVV